MIIFHMTTSILRFYDDLHSLSGTQFFKPLVDMLHVFVEKPFGFNLSQAEQMADAAEASGVKMMVGYMKRYFSEHMPHQNAIVAENPQEETVGGQKPFLSLAQLLKHCLVVRPFSGLKYLRCNIGSVTRESVITATQEEAYRREWMHFHTCITEDKEPLTSGRDAVNDIRLMSRIMDAVR